MLRAALSLFRGVPRFRVMGLGEMKRLGENFTDQNQWTVDYICLISLNLETSKHKTIDKFSASYTVATVEEFICYFIISQIVKYKIKSRNFHQTR